MSKRVFITGYGIICAAGNNAAETLDALMEGRSGIGEITHFKTIHQGKLPMAEVKKSHDELCAMTGVKGAHAFTRTALLGMVAAREAIVNAGITDIGKHRTGLISATTVGGMDRSEDFYELFLANENKGRLRDIVNHDCADSTERIADFTGISEFVTTISTACSSSANAMMLGAQMIKAGMIDRVVAGGTDSVTRFTLNGFNTLMILDRNGCRPFDENRAGLTIGEGAAYVVLESEDVVARDGKIPLAELTGYGNANDAFHQTASSPDGTGARLAMEEALRMAGLQPDQIDYINAHGTGTQNNDLSEGIAMETVFDGHVPPFSSTKSYTGHTLGAAGAIEAVISLLSVSSRCIFPVLNWSEQMKELKIRPVTSIQRDADIRNILSNSFGFGGNNSTIILSAIR
jgi:3-oxoacyl-[acyl-carrier-protein] synthase-1